MTAAKPGTNPEHHRANRPPLRTARPKGESNKFVYDASPETGKPLTTHQWYDGTPHPWEFKRVWHLEPSLTDPDTVYAGVEDAALFRSTDGGQNWQELAGLRGHGTGPDWRRAPGECACTTIILDPKNPNADLHRDLVGGRVSHRRWRQNLAADQPRLAFALYSQSDRGGRPLRAPHRHAPFAARTCCSCRSTGTSCAATTAANRGTRSAATCRPISASSIDVHAHEPETIYVVPIKSDSEHFPPDGKLRVYRSRTGGNEWEALTKGLPQSDCYVNVLRDAMAVDSLDKCGVYFGTTGGQVYASADAGDNWAPIVRDLPAVVSVEVQTLP